MNKAVSSVTENQFDVSADLLLFTKLVPKIGSILELRTNARQHNIVRLMTSCNCRLNQDEQHVAFNSYFFTSVQNKYDYSKEQLRISAAIHGHLAVVTETFS